MNNVIIFNDVSVLFFYSAVIIACNICESMSDIGVKGGEGISPEREAESNTHRRHQDLMHVFS